MPIPGNLSRTGPFSMAMWQLIEPRRRSQGQFWWLRGSRQQPTQETGRTRTDLLQLFPPSIFFILRMMHISPPAADLASIIFQLLWEGRQVPLGSNLMKLSNWETECSQSCGCALPGSRHSSCLAHGVSAVPRGVPGTPHMHD